MKKIILTIFSLLLTIQVQAANPKCDPLALRDVNEAFAVSLFCATLKNGFQDCIARAKQVGFFFYFFGAVSNHNTQTMKPSPGSLLAHKNLPLEAKTIIKKIQDSSGAWDRMNHTSQLISELRNHPKIFYHEINGLTRTRWWLRAASGLKILGTLSLIGAYASEVFLTAPEDCMILNIAKVEPIDKKWISYGINCSKYVNPDFFSLTLDQQMEVTNRSPRLCEVILGYKAELEKM